MSALAAVLLAAAAADADIIERLGERAPVDLEFIDASGRAVRLGDVFQSGRPVLLTLVYYRCPVLCSTLLAGLGKSLAQTGLALGRDYQGVTVSIDPTEPAALAAERRRVHLGTLGVPAASGDWPFLVGSATAVRALAESVGFSYGEAGGQEFIHVAVAVVLTPDGRVARYFYGTEFRPRDLRLALVEASGGRVGTTVDRVLLKCMRFDPSSRRYTFMFGFLRGGALAVFLALAALLAVLWRREAR